MKSFKEFQTESYSRLDENKLATDILSRGFRAFTGKQIYDTLGPDAGNSLPGKDYKKIKSTKGNWKGQTASAIATGLGDQIVKKGWKYGVKPAYGVAKWGLTKGIPAAGAVTLAALKQVFGGGVDRI